jgi:hypothetical protein
MEDEGSKQKNIVLGPRTICLGAQCVFEQTLALVHSLETNYLNALYIIKLLKSALGARSGRHSTRGS